MGGCSSVSDQAETATTYIYGFSALLSVLGSTATIIMFLSSKEKTKQRLFQLIFSLSVADFFASSGILLSQILLLYYPNTYNHNLCVGIRSVVQYFLTCSFFWTCVISVHIYRALNQKPEHKLLNLLYHTICWGAPAVFMTTILANNQIEKAPNAQWCHLTKTYEWTFWFAPMILSVFFNTIFYFLITSKIKQNNQPGQGRYRIRRQLSLYILAFIVCWIFDVAEHAIGLFTDCPLFWLWILQDFFSPLQGFLNFIVYGFSTRMIRLPWKPKTASTPLSSRTFQERPLISKNPYGYSISTDDGEDFD